MKLLQLPENYRCPAEVVKIANKLIAYIIQTDFLRKKAINGKKTSHCKLKSGNCSNHSKHLKKKPIGLHQVLANLDSSSHAIKMHHISSYQKTIRRNR